jgi:hypothetical protein
VLKERPKRAISVKPTMPCVLCGKRYSELDVHEGTFFVSTMICRKCYLGQQRLPHKLSCFGKRNKQRDGVVVAYGYDRSSPECGGECPDRRICQAFIQLTSLRRD